MNIIQISLRHSQYRYKIISDIIAFNILLYDELMFHIIIAQLLVRRIYCQKLVIVSYHTYSQVGIFSVNLDGTTLRSFTAIIESHCRRLSLPNHSINTTISVSCPDTYVSHLPTHIPMCYVTRHLNELLLFARYQGFL